MSGEWVVYAEWNGRSSIGRQRQVASGASSLSVLSGFGWIPRSGLEVAGSRGRDWGLRY